MLSPSLMTPPEMALYLADRVRQKRLEHKWTQANLASRSGIALPTLKRFETTGKISLERLLKIANILGCLPEFGALLSSPPPRTIKEILESEKPRRKYGQRNS